MKYMTRKSFLHLKIYIICLSLLLGISFGLSIYSYWLIDFVPPTSRRIFFYVVLSILIGFVGHYFLFEFWLIPGLSGLARQTRSIMIGISALIGFTLVLVGTNAPNSPSSYLTFLLPSKSLKISVSPLPQASQTNTRILWFITSVENISYDSLHYYGWKKSDNVLILTDPLNNTLEWTGKPGEEAKIVFSKSPEGGTVNISWDGEVEVLSLFSDTTGKYLYTHNFAVPFYASRLMVLLLLELNFFVFCCAINLLIWKNRTAILGNLSKSIFVLSRPKDDGTTTGREFLKHEKTTIWDWVFVIGMLASALLLRAFHLENLNPYQDEYTHLIAARQILEGAPIVTVYQRSLFIVTLPVVFFFRLFGPELWAARLVGVLCNVLAIVPLYLLTRKINRPIALLSCALYATNPWIISVSRNVREYGYYPFFFYWVVYGMIVFIGYFPERFVLINGWRKVFRFEFFLVGLLLILPIIYSLGVDPSSTFQIILIAYGVFGLCLLGKLDLRNKVNLIVLFIVAIGFFWGGYYLMAKNGSISMVPSLNTYFFRYFFLHPQQQWYFNRLMIVPVVALIGGAILSFIFWRVNFVPSFLVKLCIAFTLFFSLFFNRNIRPRYIINIEYWYLIILAVGLYGIWVCLKSIFSRNSIIALLISFILLLLTLNVTQILLPTFYNKQGYMPITEEYHYDIMPVHVFLLSKVNSNDILISNVYGGYVLWRGEPIFKATYPFNFYTQQSPQDYILSIVDKYNSGWIVLNNFLYGSSVSFPHVSMTFKNKTVEYLGVYGDQSVWKWQTGYPSP